MQKIKRIEKLCHDVKNYKNDMDDNLKVNKKKPFIMKYFIIHL